MIMRDAPQSQDVMSVPKRGAQPSAKTYIRRMHIWTPAVRAHTGTEMVYRDQCDEQA